VATPDEDPTPALSTLQEAALQLLGAAKLFIAAAEEAVADPKSLGRIGEVVSGAVTDLARAANRFVTSKPSSPDEPDDGLEHIDLSD